MEKDIIRDAMLNGLLAEYHDPDEPAPKWFVAAMLLNLKKTARRRQIMETTDLQEAILEQTTTSPRPFWVRLKSRKFFDGPSHRSVDDPQ